MIGAYVRVSGPDQNERGQHDEIQKWLEANGLKARFYLDKQTGDNLDRPAFQRLQREHLQRHDQDRHSLEIGQVEPQSDRRAQHPGGLVQSWCSRRQRDAGD